MKKGLICIGLLILATLMGCENRHAAITERIQEMFDMGSVPLKNGYALHGYRLILKEGHDHFVYVLELEGVPVAGTSNNYTVPSGKSSYQQTVTSIVPSIRKDTCLSVVECEQKLAALKENNGKAASRLYSLQKEYEAAQAAQ